jgi:hypothetical protein
MSRFDYETIGRLRIQLERLQARLDRLEQTGDRLIPQTRQHEWDQAKAWDGTPATRIRRGAHRNHNWDDS